MHRIAFCVIATNSFFTLGLRFLNKFHFYYEGEVAVSFYFFSDEDPAPYLPDGMDVHFRPVEQDNWVEAVNSKPFLISSLLRENELSETFSFLYYVDADTDITRPFNESSFQGDMVGLEHFMNDQFENPADYPFDRVVNSACYIPLDSEYSNFYYHACFYGGHVDNMQKLCEVMLAQIDQNRQIRHEPAWNDESLLNFCFHYSPPFRTIASDECAFLISDKGGIEEIRNPDLDLEAQKALIRQHRNECIRIENGEVKPGFD